ncbi:MAG: hypothetical protein WCG38_15400, partial [Aestuariivirga sp.]
DSADPVTVTLPSGKTETVKLEKVSPGRFDGAVPVTEAGLYRLADGKLMSVAAAGSGEAKEMANLRATADVLEPVAKASGGGVDWLEDGMPQVIKVSAGRQMAGAGWIGLRANDKFRVETVSDTPLFATLLSLAVLLLAFAGMWYREGH